jgi:hypothetical protein
MLRTKTVMGFLLIAVLAALVMVGPGTASAQTQDVFWVAYYNTGVTSASQNSLGGVAIINPGTSGGTLCADVYVFDPAQELKECCALPVSIDGGLFLSLTGFTNNPANGVYSSTGMIKIVADQSSNCNPANPTPTPELRASIFNVNSSITETEFQPTPLSNQELYELGLLCSFIPNQSGPGFCQSVDSGFAAKR